MWTFKAGGLWLVRVMEPWLSLDVGAGLPEFGSKLYL